jgi:hypothetical protein
VISDTVLCRVVGLQFGLQNQFAMRQCVSWKTKMARKHDGAARCSSVALVVLLFLFGKLLLDSRPCSRPEVPAIVIPAAMEFLRPLQRIDRRLKRRVVKEIMLAETVDKEFTASLSWAPG